MWPAWALTLIALAPRLAHADDLGAIAGFGVLILGGIVVLGATVVFAALAVARRRVSKSGGPRRVLVPLTRLLATAWYIAAIVPIGLSLRGHDTGWIVLFCLGGGAPAHIAALVAILRTRAATATAA